MSEAPGTALTHLDEKGEARMVDVSDKAPTRREALARALVRMQPATRAQLDAGQTPKGDVFATARIAGIQAAKRTPELIPLCHAIALSSVKIEITPRGDDSVEILARAVATDRTGVEMEALTAASIAALTLYDMLKAVDRGMSIERIELVEKHGGRSGSYVR